MESGLTLTLHATTTVGILSILALLLKEHKIWIRMKDRVNSLWSDYCEKKKIPFGTLDENGNH